MKEKDNEASRKEKERKKGERNRERKRRKMEHSCVIFVHESWLKREEGGREGGRERERKCNN